MIKIWNWRLGGWVQPFHDWNKFRFIITTPNWNSSSQSFSLSSLWNYFLCSSLWRPLIRAILSLSPIQTANQLKTSHYFNLHHTFFSLWCLEMLKLLTSFTLRSFGLKWKSLGSNNMRVIREKWLAMVMPITVSQAKNPLWLWLIVLSIVQNLWSFNDKKSKDSEMQYD